MTPPIRPFLAATLAAAAVMAPSPAATEAARAAVRCHGRVATIVGTPGHDVVHGTDGRDVVVTRGGDDRVAGLQAHDLLCTGAGNDRVRASGGSVWTGAGHDVVTIDAVATRAQVGMLDLGPSSDLLQLVGDRQRNGFVWSGGSGRDYLANDAPDGTTRTYAVALGAHGSLGGPLRGRLTFFEDYSADEPTSPQQVIGSPRPNFVSVAGNDSDVRGGLGDDFLQTTGLDTSVDGGAGTDSCLGFGIQLNCER